MRIQELLETATGMGTSSIATSIATKKPKKGQKLNLLGTPVSETDKEVKIIKRQP
jgi:hypothetical protein